MMDFNQFYKPIDVAVHPDDLNSSISEQRESTVETEDLQIGNEPDKSQQD